MKKTLLLSVFVLLTVHVKAQHYYGLTRDELISSMKAEHPEFLLQSNVQNPKFKYLKFVDALDRRTWLFFLDEGGKCSIVKLMNDYDYLRETIDWLNENFSKNGKDRWLESRTTRPLDIELSRGEWYFTVMMKEVEN